MHIIIKAASTTQDAPIDEAIVVLVPAALASIFFKLHTSLASLCSIPGTSDATAQQQHEEILIQPASSALVERWRSSITLAVQWCGTNSGDKVALEGVPYKNLLGLYEWSDYSGNEVLKKQVTARISSLIMSSQDLCTELDISTEHAWPERERRELAAAAQILMESMSLNATPSVQIPAHRTDRPDQTILYNMDQRNALAEQTLQQNLDAIPHAEFGFPPPQHQ